MTSAGSLAGLMRVMSNNNEKLVMILHEGEQLLSILEQDGSAIVDREVLQVVGQMWLKIYSCSNCTPVTT